MLSDLQIKIGIAIGAVLLMWYAYYNIVVVPQNTIEDLQVELVEQKKVPQKIVDKINKADADRTQKEIDNEEIDKNVTIGERGVLIFPGL